MTISNNNNDYNALSNMSIAELKQLLACVNHDLKLNKPTIKRIKQEKPPVLSEADICNQYAMKYSGNKALSPSINARLSADIQIQRDILDFLNNGGMIKSRVSRKKIKPLSVLSTKIVSL